MTPADADPRKSRALEAREALLNDARRLAGLTVSELATRSGVSLPIEPTRAKGFAGRLLERALGVRESGAGPDFPGLGVELKTIPLGPDGRPRESTFVCMVSVRDIAHGDWASSLARSKLGCVLFVPIESAKGLALERRRVGSPLLWSPTPQQDAALRGDFEELMGVLGRGDAELLTAHQGRCLQVRPKARDSYERTRGSDENGASIRWLPRGFYLRARFTEQLFATASARSAQHLL